MLQDIITAFGRVEEAFNIEWNFLKEQRQQVRRHHPSHMLRSPSSADDSCIESRAQFRHIQVIKSRLETGYTHDTGVHDEYENQLASMRWAIAQLEKTTMEPGALKSHALDFEDLHKQRKYFLDAVDNSVMASTEAPDDDDNVSTEGVAYRTGIVNSAKTSTWEHVGHLYQCIAIDSDLCKCRKHTFELQLLRQPSSADVNVILHWEDRAKSINERDARLEFQGSVGWQASKPNRVLRFHDERIGPKTFPNLCNALGNESNELLLNTGNDILKFLITASTIPNPQTSGEMQSLRRIISERSLKISPSQKAELALALISSHMYLYQTKWLSASWNSEDIMFQVRDERATFSKPYLRRISGDKARVASSKLSLATPSLGNVLLELWHEYIPKGLVGNVDVPDRIRIGRAWSEDDITDAGEEFERLVKWCSDEAMTPDADWHQRRTDLIHRVIIPLRESCRHYRHSNPREELVRVAHCLKQKIGKSLVRCRHINPDGSFGPPDLEDEFCPDPLLHDLVRKEAREVVKLIRLSLSSDPLYAYDSLNYQAEIIYESLLQHIQSQKIFASLILIMTSPPSDVWHEGWARFISSCRGSDVTARSLAHRDLPLSDSEIMELFFEAGDFWDSIAPRRAEVAAFKNIQYSFCAIHLRSKEQHPNHRSIEKSKARMPFTERQLIGSPSSSGKVYKVKVHRGHFENSEAVLAMKELIVGPSIKDEWEQINWMIDQRLRHDCIMNAKASVRIGKKVMMFYELAECDLYNYMTASPGPANFQERKLMMRSIMNLARALEYLHCHLRGPTGATRIVCFHKDIKAENILVTRESPDGEPVLKLTDFGISSIKSEDYAMYDVTDTSARQTVRELKTSTLLGAGCQNTAPETHANRIVDASADLWALGTVLAEYLAWLYGGPRCLQEFEMAKRSKDDMFFLTKRTCSCPDECTSNHHRSTVMKQEVGSWFTLLIRKESQKLTFRDLRLLSQCWNLIETRLLVCDARKRAKIEHVCQHMDEIYRENCLSEDEPLPPQTLPLKLCMNSEGPALALGKCLKCARPGHVSHECPQVSASPSKRRRTS